MRSVLFIKNIVSEIYARKMKSFTRLGRLQRRFLPILGGEYLLYFEKAVLHMAEKETKIKLTAEGKRRYEAELNELKTVKRKEIAENLQTARAQGDLSENSEYDEAKNDQAKLEARIKELESILRNVEIIDESLLSDEKVHIGCTVKVFDRDYNEEVTFQIVGSSEADPFKGKISDESPVGKALIDKSVGDKALVETPGGENEFTILEISM